MIRLSPILILSKHEWCIVKAKKALKKLIKKHHNVQSNSIQKLRKIPIDNSYSSIDSTVLKAELKAISEAVSMQVLNELSAPLTPILSWFREAEYNRSRPLESRNKGHVRRAPNHPMKVSAIKNITYLPLKSPPCKRCPALEHGICKCAAKKFA